MSIAGIKTPWKGLRRSGVEPAGVTVDSIGVTTGNESEERLDRLASMLGRTTQLLNAGGTGVALKEQLIALQRALFDVVKDDAVDPSAIVQRDVPATATRPGLPNIPRPFRPVDMSAY